MANDILPPKRPTVKKGVKTKGKTVTKAESKVAKSPKKKQAKKAPEITEEPDDYYNEADLEPPSLDDIPSQKIGELSDDNSDLENSVDEDLKLKDSKKKDKKEKKKGFLSGIFGGGKKKEEKDATSDAQLTEDDLHNIREALGVNKDKPKSIQKEFEDSVEGGTESDLEMKELSVKKDQEKEDLGDVAVHETDEVKNELGEWGVHDDKSKIKDITKEGFHEDPLGINVEEEAEPEELGSIDEVDEKPFHEEPEIEDHIEQNVEAETEELEPITSFDEPEEVLEPLHEDMYEEKSNTPEDESAAEPEIHLKKLEKAAEIDKDALVKAVYSKISEHDDQEKIMKKLDKELTKVINKKKREFSKTIREKTKAINAKSKEVNKSLSEIKNTRKENDKLLTDITKEKEKLANEKKLVAEKTKQLLKLEKQRDRLKKSKSKFKKDIDDLKEKKKGLQKEVQSKQRRDNKLIEKLTSELQLLSQETEKAEKLHEAKMDRYRKEIEEVNNKLKTMLKKANGIESGLEEKEKTVNAKLSELRTLVEEERHMVAILSDRTDEPKHAPRVKRKASFAPEPGFDALADSEDDTIHQKIYDCRQILAEGKIDDAMLLYNELVEEYSSDAQTYSRSEKKTAKQMLKNLYEEIRTAAF